MRTIHLETSEVSPVAPASNVVQTLPIQKKLAIGAVDDPLEHEADAMADKVMGMQTIPVVTKANGDNVQRKCAECEKDEDEKIQRKPLTSFIQRKGSIGGTVASNSVSSQISSSKGNGNRMDASTRSFMESRFGTDFGDVKIHTSNEAIQMNRELSARAFTVDNDIYFNEREYQPGSDSGKHLLAHELTHTVQQAKSPTKIFRSISRFTNCVDNTNGAPVNSRDELEQADVRAREIATNAAILASADPVDDLTLDIYEARFGFPPEVRGGFMNRLTGRTVGTEDEAMFGELRILARRFNLIARMFSQPVPYRCIGGHASFGGCEPPHCNNVFAWSCRDVGAIFLCPDFWAGTDVDARGAILVHEAFHVNFGVSNPRNIGEVGDEELRGSGKNFNIADCCSGFAADLANVINPADTCPEP